MNQTFNPTVDVAPWVQTHSGKRFDLLNPKVDQIDAGDIAIQLSRINRYSGATVMPVSVAEHSLLVADEVRSKGGDVFAQYIALLHDAHEAYIGDMTTPVMVAFGKALEQTAHKPHLAETFRHVVGDVKADVDAAIFVALGVREVLDRFPGTPREQEFVLDQIMQAVGRADRAVLMAERNSNMAPPPASWGEKLEAIVPSVHIPTGMSPLFAARAWLSRLNHYRKELNLPALPADPRLGLTVVSG